MATNRLPHRHPLVGRRELLTAGGTTLFGLSLPLLLRGRALADSRSTRRPPSATQADAPTVRATDPRPLAPKSFGRAKSCILLFMWGGPAHQDTWDLKPHAPAEIRGEFSSIATSVPGVQICEHFRRMACRAHHLSIIRSMTHSDVNHTTSTHHLLTGQPPPRSGNLRDDWPHIGAVLARLGRGRHPLPPFVSLRPELRNTVPRFVEQSHGQFAGWLGARFDPLTIDANPAEPSYRVGDFTRPPEISVKRFANRRRLWAELDRRRRDLATAAVATLDAHYHQAFALLDSAVGAGAFDLSREPDRIRDRYGRNPHGQSVLQARRLIEHGVPLVTVFWPNDGIKNVSVYWDTHSRNFIDLKERLIPAADQAFAALLDDLHERGLLDETLVVWTGEFGRTPRIGQRNSDAGAGRDGRDHWPNCFTTVLAGAGLRGGSVYGASDRHAAFPARDPVAPVDLVATVYHLLGVPPDLVLHDNLGRPHRICPGTPVAALLS
ncbi:MAG: DUF1501 domain-containing protein [Planctomycetota bacterium]|nr:MAG: DUF1501 domain-containing protein [Planctomycetota bacterium]